VRADSVVTTLPSFAQLTEFQKGEFSRPATGSAISLVHVP
jgi:hypothetical protein